MPSHEIDFKIHGDDMQYVRVGLDHGETVIAEAGMMMYMEDGIAFEAKLGDGSSADEGMLTKLVKAAARAATQESLFLTHFTNTGDGRKVVAFAAPYPGKIVPLDLAELGGDLLCQKDAFLAAALGTQISIAFNKRFGAGLFGGEGFILQRLLGDGKAFIHACGTVQKRRLDGQRLRVDPGCLLAFTKGIEYDIQRAGNLKTMLFGGESPFLATLTGTGIVWLQSLPFSRLATRIVQSVPSKGGKSVGQGSVLGSIIDNV